MRESLEIRRNRVRLRALQMLADDIDEDEICTHLNVKLKTLRQWKNDDRRAKEHASRKSLLTPAPYKTGYAGWGTWRR